MKSDEELVAVFRQSGQREAMEELVDRHLGKVRALIYPMVLDPSLADDLTQEAFLRALRGLSGFNGRARFSTWLYRVAMNTTHGFLARQSRSPVGFRAVLPETAQAPDPSPPGAAVQAELEAALQVALGELSPRLRAAIVLTALEQLDVKEAARIEGCTTATMYWRIHEARQQLKKRLGDHLSP